MGRKVTVSELTRRIQNRELTRKEYRTFFQVERKPGAPFQPAVAFRRSAVNVGGLSAAAETAATPLAHDAMEGILAREGRIRELDAKVLAEGDSWFDLPWFYSSTIVDQLNLNHFPVREIAAPGDTLRNMIESGEYSRALGQKPYKVFMFSGGGNDVLGNLGQHLLQRESGDEDARNAPRYIKRSFIDALDEALGFYQTMVATAARVAPRAKVVVHGYAYAVANPDGPWLGRAFDFKGFDPVHHADMCAAIVKAMVDAFNIRLERLAAASRNRVLYCDFRRDMKRNDWFDELHPKPGAAGRLAAKIAKLIKPHL